MFNPRKFFTLKYLWANIKTFSFSKIFPKYICKEKENVFVCYNLELKLFMRDKSRIIKCKKSSCKTCKTTCF